MACGKFGDLAALDIRAFELDYIGTVNSAGEIHGKRFSFNEHLASQAVDETCGLVSSEIPARSVHILRASSGIGKSHTDPEVKPEGGAGDRVIRVYVFASRPGPSSAWDQFLD